MLRAPSGRQGAMLKGEVMADILARIKDRRAEAIKRFPVRLRR